MGMKTGPDPIRAKPMPAAIPSRRIRRGREKRIKHDLPLMRPLAAAAPSTAPALDPVRIAVLVMESLARASMRASFTGTEVRVAAPNAAIAAIFQAVIAETAQNRSTDRLIRIIVD
jgi:hypothetical protein